MKRLFQELSERMQSAGGRYNFGNTLDLYAVAASALVARSPHSVTDAVVALQDKFSGDMPSICLSAAALTFFAGGEAYFRAWKDEYPNRRFYFCGDMLSGVGALLLGAGLIGTGQPVLAIASGGLHALSKFGSALNVSKTMNSLLNREFRLAGHITTAGSIFKDLSLVSRAPGMALCMIDIAHNFITQSSDQATASSIMPFILAWCYTEWGRADWDLAGDKSLIKQMVGHLSDSVDKKLTATDRLIKIAHTLMYLEDHPPRNRYIAPLMKDTAINPDEVNVARRTSAQVVGAWGAILGLSVVAPLLDNIHSVPAELASIPLFSRMMYLTLKMMVTIGQARELSENWGQRQQHKLGTLVLG